MRPQSLTKASQLLHSLIAAATAASSFLLMPVARANLLNPADEAQLEAWLGQGDLDFTNLYTKQAGHNTFNFHAAVDGKGPTFTLMNIFGAGSGGLFDLVSQVIGGYNPQSWVSLMTHVTLNDADRTAFIYNLTSGTLQRQTLSHVPFSAGAGQTVNNFGYGPVFGTAGDIAVFDANDLFGVHAFSLDYGSSFNGSYGGTPIGGTSIVLGSPNAPPGGGNQFRYYVGELEVYTFAAAAGGSTVPDTAGTLGLLCVSLLGLVALRRFQD